MRKLEPGFHVIAMIAAITEKKSSAIAEIKFSWKLINAGADPGFFLGGGAFVSCSTSTPINHIVFFCRIPVVLENRRSSRGGGGAPPAPSP